MIKRFVGVEHITNITALLLKYSIDKLLSRHGLSVSRSRDQDYYGTRNMWGEFNGLKTLSLKENPLSYNVQCFVHQLQLTLVVVAKKHIKIASLFTLTTRHLLVLLQSVVIFFKKCKRLKFLRYLKVVKFQLGEA